MIAFKHLIWEKEHLILEKEKEKEKNLLIV
jgi:hypothetical protein